MADVKLLLPKILKWEGGFVNDPVDRGGATNKGVTIATWKAVGYDKDGDGDIDIDDLRKLSITDVQHVLKTQYWDKWQADKINNQSVADILVDWVWGSGKWGIIMPQRILGVKDDGKVGAITLNVLNTQNQKELFDKIFYARQKFLLSIVKNNPSQQRFIKGWMNRLVDFKYSD